MCRDIRVFIGGSSEGLEYAEKLCSFINKHDGIKCIVWDKTFEFNESFLRSLRNSCLINDFGIFLATKDDYAKIRKNKVEVPRDNIILEYGLFLGEMKNSRTYLLQEEGCKLPTDVLGYTTPRFNSKDSDEKWSKLAAGLTENIRKNFKTSIIQSLPSTSLAIGYFSSFLSKLSQILGECDGSVLRDSKLAHTDVSVEVLIPNKLSNDISAKAAVYYKKNGYKEDLIGKGNRPFPIRFYQKEVCKELSIVDLPTTLSSIRPSINLLMPKEELGIHEDIDFVERKELENFKKTLEYLVNDNDFTSECVTVKWME